MWVMNFLNLFLAVLSLPCSAQAFSSCSTWVSHCGGSLVEKPMPMLWARDSAVVMRRLCCFSAYAVFPDQGSNSCPLGWWVDSQPLDPQGSPG